MTVSPLSFYASASCMPHVAHFGTAVLMQKSRIRREQRVRAASLGERVQWVTDSDGAERMAFRRKTSGTLFILDVDLQDWVSLFDGATLTDLDRFGDPWPRPENSQALTDEDLRLPRTFADFPGFELGRHESPRYGYSDLWRESIAERAKPASLALRRPRQTLLLYRLPRQLRPRPPRLQSLLLPQDLHNQSWLPLHRHRPSLRLRCSSRLRRRRPSSKCPRHRRSTLHSLCPEPQCHLMQPSCSDPRYRPPRQAQAVYRFPLWRLCCFSLWW